MSTQYRNTKHEKSYIVNNLTQFIQDEIQKSDMNMSLLDPVITHVMLRLQPWVLTIMVIFGLYFILILAILVLILRNDIKK